MANSFRKQLTHADYTIACICPMGVELAPVEAALDCIHQSLPTSRGQNVYTLGELNGHNLVVAVLPTTGTNATAAVATQLLNDFPSVRFSLLVGIGGGVPGNSAEHDVRLGDVVVSQPTDTFGGVVQYDLGKKLANGKFQRTGQLNKPPSVLSAHVRKLQAQHARQGNLILQHLDKMFQRYPHMCAKYSLPTSEPDQLFPASYKHRSGLTCAGCSARRAVKRPPRSSDAPVIHYGTIGSANMVIKDAVVREELQRDTNVLCVEMEAAGLMDDFPCIVIRGICDYADSHKNKHWQPYAAAVAAGYMVELLSIVPTQEVPQIQHAGYRGATTDALSDKRPLAAQSATESQNQYFEVPYLLSTVFTGQSEILQRLEISFAFASPTCAKIQRRFVLFGLGGSGKTQIALKYAQTHRERYWAIFWVDASSHESVSLSMSQIAILLQVERTIDSVKRVLANTSRPWLLVVDNADDPNLPLNGYFPRGDRGDIIITSRNPECCSYHTTGFRQLGAMSPQDSRTLLLRTIRGASDPNEDDHDMAQQVVQTLGYLALAVTQAGAYIRETLCPLRTYLELYQTRRQEVLEYYPRHSDSDYHRPVFTTWRVSLDLIKSRGEATSIFAVEMLKLVCFYHHDNVPLAIFYNAWSHSKHDQSNTIWPSTISDLSGLQRLVQASVSLLASFSLATHDTHDSLSLHPLLHDIYQITLVEDRLAGCRRAVSFLAASTLWRFNEEDYVYRRLLVSHVRPSLETFQKEHRPLFNGNTTDDWRKIGLIMVESVFAQDTLWIREQILDKYKGDFGETDVRTLTAAHGLATHYLTVRRDEEAIQILEQVTKLRRTRLGETHIGTQTALHDLAVGYTGVGRAKEALLLLEQALNLYTSQLGTSHTLTLDAMHNLAFTYDKLGRQKEALSLLEQALESRKTQFGTTHPRTLDLMRNLALTYRQVERREESLQLLEQALMLRKRVLGQAHPQTLLVKRDLAVDYAFVGRREEAIELLEDVLEIYHSRHGNDHPDTTNVVYWLARIKSSSDRTNPAPAPTDFAGKENTASTSSVTKHDQDSMSTSWRRRLLTRLW